MKHKVEVVMLPTEDNVKASICQGADRQLYYSSAHPENDMYRNHYLYITVSQDVEPIKEGWVYDPIIKKVFFINSIIGINNKIFKIIATTDPKLKAEKISYKIGTVIDRDPIPQVQHSFLEEFVDNPNGEFDVDYEVNHNCTVDGGRNPCLTDMKLCEINGCDTWWSLKINKDCTVNITSVEEKMYSKEEVEGILFQYAEDEHAWFSSKSEIESFNDWIKENL